MSFLSQINDVNKTICLFIGHKSEVWKHEKEHRLILNMDYQLLQDYRPIKGFAFGVLMLEVDVDFIMKIFTCRSLEYYKIALEVENYSLKPKKLENKYKNADVYSPNNLKFDINQLLEEDALSGGYGIEYCEIAIKALDIVS